MRLGPWLVAIAIIVVLARKYEPSAVLAQMRAGRWAPSSCVRCGGADARTVAPLARYVDVMRGRAGSAMLMLLGNG